MADGTGAGDERAWSDCLLLRSWEELAQSELLGARADCSSLLRVAIAVVAAWAAAGGGGVDGRRRGGDHGGQRGPGAR